MYILLILVFCSIECNFLPPPLPHIIDFNPTEEILNNVKTLTSLLNEFVISYIGYSHRLKILRGRERGTVFNTSTIHFINITYLYFYNVM